ncbi:TPA: hypothetical protein N0F65_004317 [Lagenidium giganteum]|uniref:RING-type E3 ubiquitin transferase n=1 Tax=Lagenidium giganteum TaxID=4803 RepID=A0AAV2ZE30_9STRA|nr:TPA: hypothetical protein N0F65_004317 [Lagenidium giganteum]
MHPRAKPASRRKSLEAMNTPATIINAAALQDHLMRSMTLNLALPRVRPRVTTTTSSATTKTTNSEARARSSRGSAVGALGDQDPEHRATHPADNQTYRRVWVCETCTFENDEALGSARCAACGTPHSRTTKSTKLTLAQTRGLVQCPPPKLTRDEWNQREAQAQERGDCVHPCSICREPFGIKEQVILSCSHVFHLDCITSFERFLRTNQRVCPLCRQRDYQKKATTKGAVLHRENCARKLQAVVRGYHVRKGVQALWQEFYRQGKGDPVRRRRFLANRAMQKKEDSIDSLLAEFDKSIHLSRRVFQGNNSSISNNSPEVDGNNDDDGDDWARILAIARARDEHECSICMNALRPRDAQVLSCTHVFHAQCVAAFERFNIYEVALCPLCRSSYRSQLWTVLEHSIVRMDLDEGADDFFAALGSGEVTDFVDIQIPDPTIATNGSAGGRHGATSPQTDDRNRKSDGARKPVKKEPAKAAPKPKVSNEPTVPMEERIVNLLVPELKVNDVMLLIKKMKQAGKSDADEFSELDAEQKTAPRFRCETCGNTEQNNFITDYARGDTICNGMDGNGCGTVVQDHIVHEGSAYRKFEGEEDKSHHGPAPNKLFSSGHNLRTLISQDGEMAGNLRRAAEFVEMNLSQMGKDERRTRIGYKDQMKQKACRLIDHTISNLDLHEIVGSRAKKMFAEFRDLREHVHQFEAMVAGCVIAAYMETGKEMYSAQNAIRIAGKDKIAGGASTLPLSQNKPVDEKKLHPFTCPLCDMKFNARRGMQFHNCPGRPADSKSKGNNQETLEQLVLPDQVQPIIEIRNGKQWFKCPVCSRVYGKEESLKEHMSRHENQSKKRKIHIETSTMDTTRLQKTKTLASANPSVQVNTHEQVMFRGTGRRPWLKYLQEESATEGGE